MTSPVQRAIEVVLPRAGKAGTPSPSTCVCRDRSTRGCSNVSVENNTAHVHAFLQESGIEGHAAHTQADLVWQYVDSTCARAAVCSTQLHLRPAPGFTRLPASAWLIIRYNIVSALPSSAATLRVAMPSRSKRNLPRPLDQAETCYPC